MYELSAYKDSLTEWHISWGRERSKHMADEGERSVLYKIRWEILVMAVSLILIAVVVYAIPNDFSLKMLEEREKQRALEQVEMQGQGHSSGGEARGSIGNEDSIP